MAITLRTTTGIFGLIKWFIVAAFVIVLLNFTVASFFIVSGPSMEPNLSDGTVVLVDRIVYRFQEPKRGDLVVVKYPGDPNQTYYVKRVIGLPGETVQIKDSGVFVNSQRLNEEYLTNVVTDPNMTVQIPAGSYLTLGDNRPVSSDGRAWGAAEKRFILGRVEVGLLPHPLIYPTVLY